MLDAADKLLRDQNQLMKNRGRLRKMIGFLCLTIILIGIELGVNLECMINKNQYLLIVNDVFLYFLIFTITMIEMSIIGAKIKKKCWNRNRLRHWSHYLLITYMAFVVFTSFLLLIHTGIQIYYVAANFDEQCFFFMGENPKEDPDFTLLAVRKILILLCFIIIEILNQVLLCYAFWKSYTIFKNPEKSVSETLIQQKSGDFVIDFSGSGHRST